MRPQWPKAKGLSFKKDVARQPADRTCLAACEVATRLGQRSAHCSAAVRPLDPWEDVADDGVAYEQRRHGDEAAERPPQPYPEDQRQNHDERVQGHCPANYHRRHELRFEDVDALV